MTDKKWFEHIYIYDDLVPKENIVSLARLSIAPGWQYGEVTNPEYKSLSFNKDEKDENGLSIYDKKIYGIKHMDQYWKLSLNADQLYSWETNELGVYPVWKIIRKHINDTFENMELDIVDCYATGRTSNAISFPRKDTNDTWTILYYVNPIWELEWEGQTNFYTGSKNTNTDIENETVNIIKSIYPKPGRIVLFHSTIPHAETAPSRIFPGLKTTLVFKCFVSKNISELDPAVDPGRPKEHIIGKKEKNENI